jgi:hypothetical protein
MIAHYTPAMQQHAFLLLAMFYTIQYYIPVLLSGKYLPTGRQASTHSTTEKVIK